MILNQKCSSCSFANKCVAKAKLKVFSDEAKHDLGVTLDFKNCVDYKAVKVTPPSEEEDIDN